MSATDTARPAPLDDPARVPLRRRPFDVVRENMRAYLVVNAFAYGLFVVGFVIGLLFPELSAARAVSLEDDGTGTLVRSLVTNPPLFAVTIFGVNLVRLSLLTIVLPSLLVPFAGLAFFAVLILERLVTML